MPADVKCTTTQTSSNDCSWPNCACGEPPKNKSSANGCGSSSCSCGSSYVHYNLPCLSSW
ncbi:hypothetical protein C8T65DRAFT_634622 [Cerioporus squamosus]|nr:hypothetical protein C8T65DRAFT_634622 [Cerioporus squamosus]